METPNRRNLKAQVFSERQCRGNPELYQMPSSTESEVKKGRTADVYVWNCWSPFLSRRAVWRQS
jgi:hypothetical protein